MAPSDPVRSDVLVLGAGLVGCAIAHHLRSAGAGRVVLYDARHPCAGASGSSLGVLSPLTHEPWSQTLAKESAEEYRAISEKWGLGAYREDGGLWIARSEREATWLDRCAGVARTCGRVIEAVEVERAAKLVPQADLTGARAIVRAPEEATASTAELTFAYAELASHAGADLWWGWGAPELTHAADRWRLAALGGAFEAPALVLACGAWTAPLLRSLGHALPIAPFRTQACRLRPAPLAAPFATLHHLEQGLLVRAAPGGRLLTGTTDVPERVEPSRSDPAADFAFLERIASRFQQVLPGWGDAHVEGGWAGVCAGTPDGRPFVGPVPGSPGLYVAAGFNGSALARAGAVARRFASSFLARSWTTLLPALPSRFSPSDAELAFPLVPGGALERER